MMEQDQLSHSRGAGNLASHRNGRMPKSLGGWKSLQLPSIVFIQILRVVDQHICIFRKRDQAFIRADVAFGIRRVHD